MEVRKKHITFDLFVFIAVVFIAFVLQEIIVPLLFALLLSVLLYPIVQFLERKLRFNRIFSALTAIFISFIVLMAVFTFIGIQLKEIISKSDEYMDSIEAKMLPIIKDAEKTTGLNSEEIVEPDSLKMEKVVKDNFSNITDFIFASGSMLGKLIIVPLYMFFFLLYWKFFISFIYTLVEKKCTKEESKAIFHKLYDVQQNYFLGLITVMILVGILNSVGLLALGIDYPYFFGFLCALLLLIPYIGIIIGSLLPALVALATKDSYWYALGVIGIFGVIQFIEGNLITPKITGSKVRINAFVSILSIVVFAMLWGTSGMVLALPITASLKVLFDHSPHFKAYGFLLGEPTEEFLKSRAQRRLKIWKAIRKSKKKLIR
jgi:predicted PurR-regulated permease PerM